MRASSGRKADAKRVAFDNLDVDVPAHLLDHVFHDRGLARLRVEIEVLNDALETRAAQDLLLNRLQAVLDPGRDRRLHVALRNPLRHDQNQRVRPIQIRQGAHPRSHAHRNRDGGKNRPPLSAPCDQNDVFRRVLFPGITAASSDSLIDEGDPECQADARAPAMQLGRKSDSRKEVSGRREVVVGELSVQPDVPIQPERQSCRCGRARELVGRVRANAWAPTM